MLTKNLAIETTRASIRVSFTVPIDNWRGAQRAWLAWSRCSKPSWISAPAGPDSTTRRSTLMAPWPGCHVTNARVGRKEMYLKQLHVVFDKISI